MMDAELTDVPWSKGDVAATPEGQFGSKSIVTLKTGGTKMVHNPSGTNIKAIKDRLLIDIPPYIIM